MNIKFFKFILFFVFFICKYMALLYVDFAISFEVLDLNFGELR